MKCLSRADIEAIAERVLKAYYQLPQNKDAEIYRINPEQLVTELLGLKVEYEHLSYDRHILGATTTAPTAGGQTRILIDSFEKWYNGQFRYRKAEGPPPGQDYDPSISIHELAAILGLPLGTARYLVSRNYFKSFLISGLLRIDSKSFENWYAHQFRYKKVDQTPNGTQIPNTMSAKELGTLLGVPVHNTVYALTRKGVFKSYIVSGQLRIEVESFEAWYRGQDHYKKIGDE